MNKTSDVIVIGAGVVGCSAAYYLAKAGLKVTVLERREVAFGASGRNGTGARQSGRDNRELPLAMFGVQNIWPTLGEELGEDIEYVQNGNTHGQDGKGYGCSAGNRSGQPGTRS